MSVYAQDSFKISPRFTVNFGLRWEPTFADPDKYGVAHRSVYRPSWRAKSARSIQARLRDCLPGRPGIPAANWNGHYTNFAPRVGLVWNPHGDGRDTLRIGAAILYDSTETWFNERETTILRTATTSTSGRQVRLRIHGRVTQVETHFRRAETSSFRSSAPTSICRSIPSRLMSRNGT